jgi:membrane protein involved in D-alanine export
MIPYANPLFFYFIAVTLIPAIILGISGKSIKYYGLFACAFILFLIFGDSYAQLTYLGIFYALNLILIKGYIYLRKRYSSSWLAWTVVIISFLPLIFSKYFGFDGFGFIGISYLTFRAVEMLLDINARLINEVNLLDYTYFILFFPTISSGPIDRYRRFTRDLAPYSGEQYLNLLGDGLYKIFIGMGYKFIIGSVIDIYWLRIIPPDHTFLHTASYMYAYSLYLFFSFAGYSLIAIGVSYIFGVRVPENFNQPFISKDMKDFWQRWHMTLSFWFRDFVFMKFVMVALKRKWFRSKYTAAYLGYLITFGLMGLWHGAQIYYLLYGLYHGTLLVLTDLYQRKCPLYRNYRDNWLMVAISVFVTFNLICFGFLIFSGYLFG